MAPDITTPLIKQGWLRAVLFMLLFMVFVLPAGMLTGMLLTGNHDKHGAAVPPTVIVLALFVTSVISILLTVIFRRVIDRKNVMSLGFSWRGYQQEAYTGFCLGPALLGLGTLILFVMKKLDWIDVSFNASDFFIALVLMCMIALAEEMVFRGYILNNLMDSMNKRSALGISAALFALAHAGNMSITSIAAVNLLLGGLLLGINYIYTRNLWFGIAFHFSWNFFQGPVLGYEVSGLPLQSVLRPNLNGPWWITGTPFGFEGSLVTTFLFIIALLLLFAAYEKIYEK
jgi:membrane protease YdiL (CAAX protease family)